MLKKNRDVYSILEEAKRLLEADEDQNNDQQPNNGNTNDLLAGLDDLGDKNSDQGTEPNKPEGDDVPDLDGNDTDKEPDEPAGTEATEEGTTTVSGNKDDVQSIIDNALKSGKKVRIEIASESNGQMTARFISESRKSKSSCSTAEYKALKKKQRAGKEPLTKAELRCIADYEKAEADRKADATKKVNESIIDAIHVIDSRIRDVESQLGGKQAINRVVNESNIGRSSKSVTEAMNVLDAVKRSLSTQNISTLFENINNGTNAKAILGNKILKRSMRASSIISENAAAAINNVAFYNIISNRALVEQANNSLQQTHSMLNRLIEDSAMSMDADGFEKSMVPNFIEAPKYVDQRVSDMAGAKNVQMSDTGDGYDTTKPQVYKLPISKNQETGKLSINSALSAVAEAFTNDKGKFDANNAKNAFLYQKVKNAKAISDFILPIATIEEGRLVAVPSFIKTAAKILANENSLSTIYKIPSAKHAELRSKLMPYLQELKMECPWEQ